MPTLHFDGDRESAIGAAVGVRFLGIENSEGITATGNGADIPLVETAVALVEAFVDFMVQRNGRAGGGDGDHFVDDAVGGLAVVQGVVAIDPVELLVTEMLAEVFAGNGFGNHARGDGVFSEKAAVIVAKRIAGANMQGLALEARMNSRNWSRPHIKNAQLWGMDRFQDGAMVASDFGVGIQALLKLLLPMPAAFIGPRAPKTNFHILAVRSRMQAKEQRGQQTFDQRFEHEGLGRAGDSMGGDGPGA